VANSLKIRKLSFAAATSTFGLSRAAGNDRKLISLEVFNSMKKLLTLFCAGLVAFSLSMPAFAGTQATGETKQPVATHSKKAHAKHTKKSSAKRGKKSSQLGTNPSGSSK
jgi:hypothetical protein